MKSNVKLHFETVCAERSSQLRAISRAIGPSGSFVPFTQRGFTLVEILIALLVLSIGLIGIAALHLVSLQNASASYNSSLASSIALDFEERLWLEIARVPAGECVTKQRADNIASALGTLWLGGALAGPESGVNVAIPTITITAGTVSSPIGPNSQTQVGLTIRWVDQRFEDGTTEFFHQASVPCFRPQLLTGN